MEMFKGETGEILRRYLARQITFAECLSMLNMALTGVIPELSAPDRAELDAVIRANTKIIIAELEGRQPSSTRTSHGLYPPST